MISNLPSGQYLDARSLIPQTPYLLKRSKPKRTSSIVSSRADGPFEKFKVGRGKGRSGSGLPVTIPGDVSAGAGASEYVQMRRSAVSLSGSLSRIHFCRFLEAGRSSKNRLAKANDRASMTLGTPIRMNNDPLDPMDQLEPAIAAVLQRLRRLAPAAIEDGVGGRDAGRGRSILAPHDADENADRGSGVTTCQGANFKNRLGLAHLGFPVGRSAIVVWRPIDRIGGEIPPRRAEGNCRKIRLRVIAFGTRDELNDVGAHENSSDTAMTTRPTSASEIRQAVIGFSLQKKRAA